MIELDSLKFTVDTTDLKTAITAVGDLQAAVSKLNKPLAENAKISAKVAQENAKVAIAEEKAAQAKNKTAESQARVEAAQNRATKAAERVTNSTKQQTTVLEKNQSIYEFMLQGYSKGQATTLAAAKAQGALADELMQVGKVLQDQRKLMGGDPFDKSMQGLISLKNALVDMDAENRMVNQGIQLTSKQYKELSRDLQRITETSIATGESFETMTARLDHHKRQFVEVASSINRLTEVEKERERSQRLQANAIRAIAAEDEKMESILRSLNVAQSEHITVSEKAARSIANYERNLRLAGVSGEVAATKLDKFRKSAMMAAQADEKRKVDMLSRALAPQISDVVVSLGSGMNPMTVLLQQGLQVRDLIGLSGVAVNDLQTAFRSAASDMVSSLKGTAVALGSLLIGGLMDAGKAVIDLGAKITGTSAILGVFENKLFDLTSAGTTMDKVLRGTFSVFARLASLLAGLSVVVLPIAALISFAVALRSVIKEENELNRVLNLTGRIAGVTSENVSAFTSALKSQGIAVKDSAVVISEMAKTGGFLASQIEMVTKTSVKLNKVIGQDVATTVKQFSDISKKPSEALIEWASKTGLVDSATIKLVISLEEAGKKTEAATVAMKAYANASENAANTVQSNYGYLTTLGLTLKDIWNDTWDAIMGWGRKADPADRLRELQEKLSQFQPNEKRLAVLGDKKRTEEEIASILRGQLNASNREIDKIVEQNKVSAISKLQGMGVFGLDKDDQIKRDIEQIRKLGIEAGYSEEKIKKMIDTYKSKNKSSTNTEANKISNAYARDIERISDMQNKAIGITEDLTDAEILLRDIRSSENWERYTTQQQNKIVSDLTELSGLQRKIKLEKELSDIRMKTSEMYVEDLSLLNESNRALAESNFAAEQEIELMGLEKDLIHEITQARLQQAINEKKLNLIVEQGIEGNEKRVLLLEQEIALLEKQKGLNNTKFFKQESVDLRESVVDAITTGLFEGGKAGSKKLRDIIEAELQKPITVFIRAFVSDIMGLGGSSGTASFANTISKGTDLLRSIMNFGSNFGTELAFAVDKLGSWLVNNTSGILNKFGGSLMKNAGTIGNIGQAAGNVFGGYALQKGISNGFKVGNGKLVDIATLVGSYFFGPLAGVVAGLFNRAFGRKLKDVGIEGTFSGENSFEGNTYQFYKGGWFRSDKTKRSELDPVLESGLGEAYGALSTTNRAMSDYIGIDSESVLEGFTSKIKFSTQGLKPEQIQKKFEEALLKVAEEQAAVLLRGFESFIDFGESSLEALTRLSGSLKAVNTFLENTNDNLLEFSLVGADMASSLVELFGGVDQFSSISSAYYQNFFTEQERLAKGNELLANAFEELNISMPSTVSAYRQLVESQDLTTESGRETFTALLTLSSAFYELQNASSEAVNTIVEEINRLRGVVGTSSLNGFEGTRASFLEAITLAQAGDAQALASIPGLSQSLEEMFMSSAGSLEDVNRFRSWLANSMGSVVPAFASGGVHSGGLRIVGENGPELEMTGPSRIFSNNDTMQMLSSEGVIKAIEVMNSNIDMLRAEVRADVQHNAKTAKLLDRVIPDGDSIKTSAITP